MCFKNKLLAFLSHSSCPTILTVTVHPAEANAVSYQVVIFNLSASVVPNGSFVFLWLSDCCTHRLCTRNEVTFQDTELIRLILTAEPSY